MVIKRLALFGTPGAGKSTTFQIISAICRNQSIACHRVRLAEPFYACQAAIYQIAGCNLPDFYSQDGELLNFLGLHLRRINPTLVHDRFHATLDKCIAELLVASHARALIVCDDMRQPDARFVKALGFVFVNVVASAATCLQRRNARGDLSLGSVDHATEKHLYEIIPDCSLSNEGSIEALEAQSQQLIEMFFQ